MLAQVCAVSGPQSSLHQNIVESIGKKKPFQHVPPHLRREGSLQRKGSFKFNNSIQLLLLQKYNIQIVFTDENADIGRIVGADLIKQISEWSELLLALIQSLLIAIAPAVR